MSSDRPPDRPPDFPLHEIVTSRRVEFADTDMAGIVHFARFFVFMESAEHELLRALGAEVNMRVDGKRIGWPRKASSCEFFQPLRFGERVEIRVRVVRKGKTSLTFEHSFERDGELLARGRMTSVCCWLDAPGGLEAMAIPAQIADRLAEAPPVDSQG